MAHVDLDELRDAARVGLARTLREAQAIEEVLTGAGVDYSVQVEAYARSFLFGTLRHGAVFYVSEFQAAYSRERLSAAGFAKAVVLDEEAPRHE